MAQDAASGTGRHGQAKESLNVVGLLSGGKDSCYNLCHCAALGHRIVAVATLSPPEGKDELDSYMYQTVGHDVIHLVAEAMQVPLYRRTIEGQALNQTSTYGDRLLGQGTTSHSAQDETEDLYQLLCQVKKHHPEVNAVSVGAILSNYQRVRVEHVAMRADVQLLPLSFLWQRDQAELLDEMCRASMNCILVKVAGAGLDESDLGRSLKQMRTKLHKLHDMYGSHICGEGGEYETITLDCSLFKRRIVLDQVTPTLHGSSSSDGVYYLKIDRAHLEDKSPTGADGLDSVQLPSLLDECSTRALRLSIEEQQKVTQSTARCVPNQENAATGLRQRISTSKHGPWLAVGGLQGARSEDAAKDFASAFAALKDALSAHQMSMAHLCHLNVYLASQTDFAVLNSVYKTIFGVDPPSRACIAAVEDADDTSSRVVIDAIAYDNDSVDGKYKTARKALHVQGRSYWAAANIGPYSQAVEVRGCLTISGQIGLDPKTLQMVEEPERQIICALQHARRVYKAMLDDRRIAMGAGWIESCVCWMSDVRWLEFANAVWNEQSAKQNGSLALEEEESDDEEREETWEDAWLGQGVSAKDVPHVFALLAADALPRNAVAEWQLTAHNGDPIANQASQDGGDDDDDDDDMDSVIRPKILRDSERIGLFECHWQTLSSHSTRLKCGIAYIRSLSEDNEHPSSDSKLKIALSSALHVRILYNKHAELNDFPFAALTSDAATTFIPVEACFDPQLRPIDAAIVWQARSAT